jgi:hypothetical protein
MSAAGKACQQLVKHVSSQERGMWVGAGGVTQQMPAFMLLATCFHAPSCLHTSWCYKADASFARRERERVASDVLELVLESK